MSSNKKDSLGDRMKYYENISRGFLIKKIPVLIRIDGQAFHTLLKNVDSFDNHFIQTMADTAQFLCEKIQGCKLAYVQSDEISLVLIDYPDIKTDSWFGYNIQKLASSSASMATSKFITLYNKMATFDSRCWNIPEYEVINYFIWRQQDCTRNAINSLARMYFSHKQLLNQSCEQMQEMMFSEHGINFNDLDVYKKRGICIVKDDDIYQNETQEDEDQPIRKKWTQDLNIPIFTQDREYITSKIIPLSNT